MKRDPTPFLVPAGRYSFVYDGSDRVSSVIDENGNRSTFLYASATQNAVLNAQNQRTFTTARDSRLRP